MADRPILIRRCPKCGSKDVSTERRPDGNSECGQCQYSGLTKYFDTYQLEPDYMKVSETELRLALVSLYYDAIAAHDDATIPGLGRRVARIINELRIKDESSKK